MICSISGPSLTGKSTLISLLKDVLPPETVYFEDIYEVVWKEMVAAGVSEFQEITKDRDFMFIYITKLVDEYRKRITEASQSPNLIIMDGCYLDILIYSILNMWYHYPLVELQEKVTDDLLELKDGVDLVYMTQPDDNRYATTFTNVKGKMSSYKRKRSTELSFYDIFRDNNKVITLPSSNVNDCDFFIKEDLRARGLIL